MSHRWGVRCGLFVLALSAACALATIGAARAVPNGEFEEGVGSPTGWRLEGSGAWESAEAGRFVSVTGKGDDFSCWRTTDLTLSPNTLYRLAFRYAAQGSGGCVVAGPDFRNQDSPVAAGWQQVSVVFLSPSPAQAAQGYVRLGQWHVTGKVSFDDVRLSPVQPVHRRVGGLLLGEGERVAGSNYEFVAPLASEGGSYARPLDSFTATFNTNRWAFDAGTEVVYRHGLPGARQLSARAELNCSYHTAGAGVLEASADGRAWTEVARFGGVGAVRAELPGRLLPAENVYVRIRAAGAGYFQVDSYQYVAELDSDMGEAGGATAYADVTATSPALRVELLSAPAGSADASLGVAVQNTADTPRTVRLKVTVTPESGEASASEGSVLLPAGRKEVVALPCALRTPGENTIAIEAVDGNEVLYGASFRRSLLTLEDATYGHALPSGGPADLWWCEGAYKVSRARPVPTALSNAVELAAARNEYEPVQIVVRPREDLSGARVSVSDLAGPAGRLLAENVTVAQIEYVNVTRPTDAAGASGQWPDPLPPFEQGRRMPAGINHPLWVTVYVPLDQPAGVYEGALTLTSDQWRGSVPLRLRVWDFALPKESHLQTAFGLWPHAIRAYHNLETTDELRQVLDLYLKDFAAHRIAPYDPAPLDSFQVEFSAGRWEGGEYDAARPHDGRRCRKVTDASGTESVAAYSADLIGLDPRAECHLSWWARTEKPGQPYLVTLSQHDEAGQWMSGNNVDVARTGSGQWQKEEVTLAPGRLNPRARAVRVFLRPAPWTEGGEATGTAWFDDVSLTPAGGDANLVPEPGFELESTKLTAKIDFEAFDRQCERYLDGLGFNTLMISLRGMPGGTFHAHSRGRIVAFAQGTPEYEALMASQGRQIVEHLRRRGWLRKAYVYWFDEPEPKDYAFVAEGMELLKRAAPGLTRMLTEQPEETLAGHVDLWCPVVSAVTAQAVADRREHDEHVWWYVCTGPKAPYIGLFIDRPAVDLRVWAWLSRKWGVEGHLVWATNYWTSEAAFPPPDTQNPWQDPMSYVSGYGSGAGQVGFWGNGDGRFLYPPNRDPRQDKTKHLTGPVPSIRWEMLREGVEDYEYFRLLDELIAEAPRRRAEPALVQRARRLAAVPDAVITDDRTYSKDPQPLYAHRRQLAEMIEELGRALGGRGPAGPNR